MRNEAYFSDICIEKCGGLCCDPWWGIISFPKIKEGGLSNLNSFRAEVVKAVRERAERIVDGYVTNETPKRRLFGAPERYNVFARDIQVNGSRLVLTVMAMFAFRCRFLSDDKVCTIHPAILGGADVRPPHCGYMGSLNVSPDEKGYCRIIHSANTIQPDEAAIVKAIETEKGASLKHYTGGVKTVEEAADRLITQIKDFCERNAPGLIQKEGTPASLGRNDPCHCGSGKKFKKCHGG